IEDWCIGCGLCATNCPYGSIQMHDIGLIAEGEHGWRYERADRAGGRWQRRRYRDGRWHAGPAPFRHDPHVRAVLGPLDGSCEVAFRLSFRVEQDVLRPGAEFELAVWSPNTPAGVWLNGAELVPEPQWGYKQGRRKYLLARERNALRAGRNVLAVRVTPTGQ